MSDARRAELLDELHALCDWSGVRYEPDADGYEYDETRPPRALSFEIEGIDAEKMAKLGAILTELSTLWPRVSMTGEKT